MQPRVDVTAFVRSLGQLGASIEQSARDLLTETATFAADTARTSPYFRDRSHALRDSIRRTIRGEWHQVVSAGTFGKSTAYAEYVEDGTRPHPIHAKGKKNGGADFLRFVVAGVVYFRKSVNHPGTPGDKPTHYKRHFMADAQSEAADMIPRFSEATVGRLFR
jgi:hypothetical protein